MLWPRFWLLQSGLDYKATWVILKFAPIFVWITDYIPWEQSWRLILMWIVLLWRTLLFILVLGHKTHKFSQAEAKFPPWYSLDLPISPAKEHGFGSKNICWTETFSLCTCWELVLILGDIYSKQESKSEGGWDHIPQSSPCWVRSWKYV